MVSVAFRFCNSCGFDLSASSERPSRHFEGERRQASVIFSDLTGYTSLNERLDPEEVQAIVGPLKAEAVAVVEAHGGMVNQFVGDEILALFGVPTAHSDDARRAIRAAVELHSLARRHSEPLERERGIELGMHTGIATGLVLTKASDYRDGRFGVTGDTVNLAARLRSLAEGNEICVDEETHDQATTEYVFEALEATRFKGKEHSVSCFRLTEAAPSASHRTRFVGRQRELRQVGMILERCIEERSGEAIYLRGEAGIGKTRLLEEIQRLAAERGVERHTGHVLDFGGGAGRDAIRTLVQSLLEVGADSDLENRKSAVQGVIAAGACPATALPFLNDLFGIPQTGDARTAYDGMGPETRTSGLREATSAVVSWRSGQQPLLLAIEDLHWADAPTLRPLADLTAGIADLPVLLILTSRIEGDPIDDAWLSTAGETPLATIDLGPLGREDATALAQEYLDTSRRAAQACIERAEGNPLFLEQLLHHAEEMETEGVPGSVQSIVLARLDSLPPSDKSALQAASVLGQRFPLEALRSLIADPGYDCAEPIRHYLVRPEGGGFLFSHALIQEGIYASLLHSRARYLHVEAAGWYAGKDPALRAQHFDRAGDPEAARAYMEAAEAQAAAYQHELALLSLDRCLEIAKDDAEKCAASRIKGKVLHDLGSIPEAMAAYEESLECAADGARRCRARIGIAGCLRMRDRPDEAFPILELAEREAREAGLHEELSELHFLRGNLHFSSGHYDECEAEHRKALDYALEAGSVEGEARALGGLGDAYWSRLRFGTATDYYRRCSELAREHGFGRIEGPNYMVYGAGLVYTDHRKIERGLEVLNEAAELARRVSDPRTLSLCLWVIALIYADSLSDMGPVDEIIEESVGIARRIQNRRLEVAEYVKGLVAYRRGESEGMIELMERALGAARDTGINWTGPQILGALALVTTDPERRRSYLEEGETLLAEGCTGQGYLFFFRHAIDVALREADWGEAERCAGLLEGYLVEPWPHCEMLIERGRLLAAYGRGDRNADLVQRIGEMRAECESLGLWAPCFDWVLGALEAGDELLTSLPTSSAPSPAGGR